MRTTKLLFSYLQTSIKSFRQGSCQDSLKEGSKFRRHRQDISQGAFLHIATSPHSEYKSRTSAGEIILPGQQSRTSNLRFARTYGPFSSRLRPADLRSASSECRNG